MRRTLLGFVFATSLVWALPGGALAAPADVASGAGVYQAGAEIWEFRFAARSGPLGEDATGIIILERTDGAFSVEAEVFCLSVTEHLATLVGDITQTQGFEEFDELVLKVNDNRTLSTPDTMAHILTTDGLGQANCFPQTVPHPVVRGNVLVRDALP